MTQSHAKPRPRIRVVAGDELSSRMIEGFGGGQWSHMANILADRTVIDARSDRMRIDGHAIDAGVQLRPAGYLDCAPRWAEFEAPPGSDEAYEVWRKAGFSQIPKDYDVTGILDFASALFTGHYRDREYAPENPSASKAWFCDELAVWMARKAKLIPVPPTAIYTLTPGSALNLFIGAGWRLVDHRGLRLRLNPRQKN